MWIIDYYKKVVTTDFFNFKGRARRKEYWSFVLVNFLIGAFFAIMLKPNLETGSFEPGWLATLYNVYGLVVFIPSVSVWIRRLHDVGKSGWWILLLFVPLLGGLYLLYLSIKDSEPGSNRFGPNPKEDKDDVIVV